MAGYGQHRSQWVKSNLQRISKTPVSFEQVQGINLLLIDIVIIHCSLHKPVTLGNKKTATTKNMLSLLSLTNINYLAFPAKSEESATLSFTYIFYLNLATLPFVLFFHLLFLLWLVGELSQDPLENKDKSCLHPKLKT